MRARRLIRLLLLLQTRGSLSARELAVELTVSHRTVQRDIEALVEAGVPIRAARGAAGGYSLASGYRTRLNGLSKDEAGALFLAGVPGPAAELGLGTVFTSAQLKILAALPAELRDEASRAARLFHLDAPAWFERSEKAPQLATVAGALWQGRRLNARYRSGEGEVARRILAPLGLVLKAGVWYLVAESGNEIRGYRLARLTSVSLRDDDVVRPADFDLASFWSRWLEEFEASRPQVEVRVRIHRSAVAELRRSLAPRDRAVLSAAAAAGRADWLEASVPFERLEHAHRDLLGLGDRVEVLGPATLREQVAATARTVASLYGPR